MYRNILAPIRDFVYPPVCLTCDTLLEDDRERICAPCWNSIPLVRKGDALWDELRRTLCADGLVADFSSCYLFEQEGVLQKVLHQLKYGGMRSLGGLLGREAGKRLLGRPDFLSADAIIPVPLNRTKRRERGYNQAEEICSGISAVTKLFVSRSVLVRTRNTESQTGLDRTERMENVRGAFVMRPEARGEVGSRTLILVDDVITTGSTVAACAAELRRQGAEKVLVVSAAIAS
jgi:ComF family protein